MARLMPMRRNQAPGGAVGVYRWRARGRGFSYGCGPWWATRDSNPDELPHTPLNRARLPVPPAARLRRLILPKESGPESVEHLIRRERWYPLQDSNSQPPDPKSGALSIELSGHLVTRLSRQSRANYAPTPVAITPR